LRREGRRHHICFAKLRAQLVPPRERGDFELISVEASVYGRCFIGIAGNFVGDSWEAVDGLDSSELECTLIHSCGSPPFRLLRFTGRPLLLNLMNGEKA